MLSFSVHVYHLISNLAGACKSWDWAYGQTPEFEYAIERNFGWGDVVSFLVILVETV